ncbi:MAG: hypothetical protein GXO82_02570 [Chlorobi bacterium]|nr:hypothetical protein [Chlorobiota bacterium]
MKLRMCIAMIFLVILVPVVRANTVTVVSIKGYAEVRRGMSERWIMLHVGDVLKPEDTIRTGEDAEVTLKVGLSMFSLPSFAILDVGDIRHLGRNDLLLKLAMEEIRGLPDSRPSTGNATPTVMHGRSRGSSSSYPVTYSEIGIMRLEGARALFRHKYYETTILTVKSTLHRYGLRNPLAARRLVARAFERLGLVQQAIDEYLGCLSLELSRAEKNDIQRNIRRLEKQL